MNDDWEDESEEDYSDDEEYGEEEYDDVEDEDIEYDNDGLTTEEERGGYIYLRHRDSKGRFASEYRDPYREWEKRFDEKLRRIEREYRKKIDLPYNEKILLLRLVDDFKDRNKIVDEKGFLNPKIHHFKRISYHQILSDHPMKKSTFSQFIMRMVDKGFVKKIKHGKKLYLKITQEGLEAIYKFLEEYPGESWRMP